MRALGTYELKGSNVEEHVTKSIEDVLDKEIIWANFEISSKSIKNVRDKEIIWANL